ncbi:hypothetical protein JHK85_050541 [Glycine max]|nr:hypothetical protein JHK85_050541 [Glycine max]
MMLKLKNIHVARNITGNEKEYIYLDDWMRFMREDEAADIPSLSAEAVKEHPDVSYNVTAPLGLHELFVAAQGIALKVAALKRIHCEI